MDCNDIITAPQRQRQVGGVWVWCKPGSAPVLSTSCHNASFYVLSLVIVNEVQVLQRGDGIVFANAGPFADLTAHNTEANIK